MYVIAITSTDDITLLPTSCDGNSCVEQAQAEAATNSRCVKGKDLCKQEVCERQAALHMGAQQHQHQHLGDSTALPHCTPAHTHEWHES